MNVGTFIQSTSSLKGDFFEDAIIFITESNDQGETGFVVNKIFSRKFNELEEFREDIDFPMYEGGPVETEKLFFLHRRSDLISGGKHITDHIFLGGDFKQAVARLNEKSITKKDIKLFVGYCGWEKGELGSEIAEGSWKVLNEGEVF